MGLGGYSMSHASGAVVDLLDEDWRNHVLAYTNNIRAESDGLSDNTTFYDCATPFDYATPYQAPTPEFSDYSFDDLSSRYTTPDYTSPGPYPIEHFQHQYDTSSTDVQQRPSLLRSQTSASCLRPPPPDYTRRRSLSHGDVDRVAALNSAMTNPTFVRLQNPRSQSPLASTKRRATKHKKSKSRTKKTAGHQRQQSDITSIPYSANAKLFVEIGERPEPDSGSLRSPFSLQQRTIQSGYTGAPADDHVVIRRMMGCEELHRSRKIIEIGAIAVARPARHEDSSTVYKKFEEVKEYLMAQFGGQEDVREACATILWALKEKKEGEHHEIVK